jgi:hypothetical protein
MVVALGTASIFRRIFNFASLLYFVEAPMLALRENDYKAATSGGFTRRKSP